MSNSVALVTGCSSGFGDLLAEPLARAGHIVYATMRDPDGKNAKPAKEMLGAVGLSHLENVATAKAATAPAG